MKKLENKSLVTEAIEPAYEPEVASYEAPAEVVAAIGSTAVTQGRIGLYPDNLKGQQS